MVIDSAVATGRLRRLFWRVADDLDYLVTLTRLRILDAIVGPEPETPADQQRARDRERIKESVSQNRAVRSLSGGRDRATLMEHDRANASIRVTAATAPPSIAACQTSSH